MSSFRSHNQLYSSFDSNGSIRARNADQQPYCPSPSNYSINAVLDQYQSLSTPEAISSPTQDVPMRGPFANLHDPVDPLPIHDLFNFSNSRRSSGSDYAHQRPRSMSHPNLLLSRQPGPMSPADCKLMPYTSQPAAGMFPASPTGFQVPLQTQDTFAKARNLARLLSSFVPDASVGFGKRSSTSSRRNSMSNFAPAAQGSNGQHSYRRRRRASFAQLNVLNTAYAISKTPDQFTRQWLGRQCGMTERSVTIWFQNKRAKERAEKAKLKQADLSADISECTISPTTDPNPPKFGEDDHLACSPFAEKSEMSDPLASENSDNFAEQLGNKFFCNMDTALSSDSTWGLEVLSELDCLLTKQTLSDLDQAPQPKTEIPLTNILKNRPTVDDSKEPKEFTYMFNPVPMGNVNSQSIFQSSFYC